MAGSPSFPLGMKVVILGHKKHTHTHKANKQKNRQTHPCVDLMFSHIVAFTVFLKASTGMDFWKTASSHIYPMIPCQSEFLSEAVIHEQIASMLTIILN